MSQSGNSPENVPAPQQQRPFLRPVYLPLALTFVGLFLAVFARSWQTRWLSFSGPFIFGLGACYFLVQTVGRVFLRQWRWSLFGFGRFVLCVAALIPAVFISLALAFGGPSEDGFADDLRIPEGISLREPSAKTAGEGFSRDSLQETLLSSLASAPVEDDTITPSVPSLRLLAEKNRSLLMRYLAASPAWRVSEDHGKLFATRRWKLDGNWQWSLNGYYSSHDLGGGFDDTNYFQWRTRLAFHGSQASQPSNARIQEGTNTVELVVTKENGADQSYCLIDCGGVLLEVFEQSGGRERRLTKKTLEFLENEFAVVLKAENWSSDLLGADATRQGAPSLELKNGMQPGIYNLLACLNPGEPGTVYLRAYEVTRDVRLSKSRLFESSNEQIGWSQTPMELFLYNTEVTIYEGDWGKPYAARLELWFRPASRAAERKLIESNFKIEGWQR